MNPRTHPMKFCAAVFGLVLMGALALSIPEARAVNEVHSTDNILYFVKPDGTLWWQADTITTRPNSNPGSAYTEYYSHKLGAPLQVGEGWNTPQGVVPGGASTIYVVRRNGILNWYRHDGYTSGKAEWQGPVTAGEGWNNGTVIPMGDGVLYTLSPNGTLRWNKHKTYKTGFTNYADWVQPSVDVMTGWNQYKMVIGGGDGVFYVVTKDGKLLWFRHSYQNPVAMQGSGSGAVHAAKVIAWAKTWQGPKEIGSAGWGEFSKMFCAGNGHIYGVKPDGSLNFWDHTGWKTGEIKWGLTVKNDPKISDGWKDYLFVFAAMPGNN